jgi:hypothetical protein
MSVFFRASTPRASNGLDRAWTGGGAKEEHAVACGGWGRALCLLLLFIVYNQRE